MHELIQIRIVIRLVRNPSILSLHCQLNGLLLLGRRHVTILAAHVVPISNRSPNRQSMQWRVFDVIAAQVSSTLCQLVSHLEVPNCEV